MTDYDSCFKNLEKLIELQGDNPKDLNEAQTRFQIIDEFFLNCLGWSKTDCKVEERTISNEGFADYVFSTSRRILIVEAKRENFYFELPEGGQNSIYSIRGLIASNPKLKDAMLQVSNYCGLKGTPYGLVSNGHQFVAFIASRTDGLDVLDGKALLARSLHDIKQNFTKIWNLISKTAISTNALSKELFSDGKKQLPVKCSETIPDYPGIQVRNVFQVELQTLSELVLEDIAKTKELEKTFLEECYCDNGALSQYSLLNRSLLEQRYELLYAEEGDGPLPVPAKTKKGISPDLLANSLSRRPILFIGDVGVGKTTFIKWLVTLEAEEIFKKSLMIYIDFGSKATLTHDVKVFFLDEIKKQLQETFDVDIEQDSFVRRVYKKDLKKFESGIYGSLRENNPILYQQKEIEELEKKLADQVRHVQLSLELLSKDYHKQTVIILDNSDQRSHATQQEIFLIAEEVSNHWNTTVFLSLRPETFNLSKKRGALSGYHAKAYTISPPRIDEVVKKRLEYALKFTSGALPLPSMGTTQLNLVNLDKLIQIYLNSIQQRPELIEFLDNISGNNVRDALDFVKQFFGSGHIDTEKIINSDNQYIIPLHEFTRAVIYGNTKYFDPQSSPIANLFDISSYDAKEHFLLPICLGFLSSLASTEKEHGFINVGTLYEKLQSLGYLPEQIDFALLRSYRKGLISTNARIEPSESFSPKAYRITNIGAYHIEKLIRTFTYIDAVTLDTPILIDTSNPQFKTSNYIDIRLENAQIFINYLDEVWENADFNSLTFSWTKISQDLVSDIERIKYNLEKRKSIHK